MASRLALFPARESSVSDIPGGDGKTTNLFSQCILIWPGVADYNDRLLACYLWNLEELDILLGDLSGLLIPDYRSTSRIGCTRHVGPLRQ